MVGRESIRDPGLRDVVCYVVCYVLHYVLLLITTVNVKQMNVTHHHYVGYKRGRLLVQPKQSQENMIRWLTCTPLFSTHVS